MTTDETGYCGCGCGERTAIAKDTNRSKSRVKGKPIRFVSGHNRRLVPSQRTKRLVRSDGYIKVYEPAHPNANGWGYVSEHVVVAARALGRPLPLGAVVHHVNGNKSDNRPGNLVICPDNAYHRLLHVRTDAMRACGDPTWRKCDFCKQYDAPGIVAVGKRAMHKECVRAYRRQLKERKRPFPE